MKTTRMSDATRGWFIGDFDSAVYRSPGVEVAVKYDKAGDRTPAHVHLIATEITFVVKGNIRINGHHFSEGDIITVEPGEPASYESIDDSITVIVKIPSMPHDKHPVDSST